MDFQYYAPTRLVVGGGKVANMSEYIKGMGTNVFLIHGLTSLPDEMLELLIENLHNHGINVIPYAKPSGEPSLQMVDEAAETARKMRVDCIVSIGGGSVIDVGKAVAGLVTNGGKIIDYLEGVGHNKKVEKPALPHAAIPTTAGTGAEVTRNAVVASHDERFKKSFRSPTLYPRIAILDANMIEHLPQEQAAYSGMDALTQLIESYLSCRATPFTNQLALWGMRLGYGAIRAVCSSSATPEQREAMLMASTLSGLCLANAGLGLAHGFASGLGALYQVPHGKACAIMLPHAMRYNQKACQDKLATIGSMVSDDKSGDPTLLTNKAIEAVERLNAELGIPQDLKTLTLPENEFETLVDMSMGNSMAGNPIEMTKERALALLKTLT